MLYRWVPEWYMHGWVPSSLLGTPRLPLPGYAGLLLTTRVCRAPHGLLGSVWAGWRIPGGVWQVRHPGSV